MCFGCVLYDADRRRTFASDNVQKRWRWCDQEPDWRASPRSAKWSCARCSRDVSRSAEARAESRWRSFCCGSERRPFQVTLRSAARSTRLQRLLAAAAVSVAGALAGSTCSSRSSTFQAFGSQWLLRPIAVLAGSNGGVKPDDVASSFLSLSCWRADQTRHSSVRDGWLHEPPGTGWCQQSVLGARQPIRRPSAEATEDDRRAVGPPRVVRGVRASGGPGTARASSCRRSAHCSWTAECRRQLTKLTRSGTSRRTVTRGSTGWAVIFFMPRRRRPPTR